MSHRRIFLQCSPEVKKTFIKQKGDTIFFKNSRTTNSWQIPYNFAAVQGQSWTTTLLQDDSSVSTFTYNVDSVTQVAINGFNLKNLYITKVTFAPLGIVKFQITERFGSSRFFFDFDNSQFSLCDADYFGERLCYQDSTFGLIQFGSKPCDYYTRNTTGVGEYERHGIQVSVYPNPVKDKLIINFSGLKSSDVKLEIINLFGQSVYKTETVTNKQEIDLSGFENGVYFLRLGSSGNHSSTTLKGTSIVSKRFVIAR